MEFPRFGSAPQRNRGVPIASGGPPLRDATRPGGELGGGKPGAGEALSSPGPPCLPHFDGP